MRTIFIDTGHGGVIHGEYQTPGKRYTWGDETFYEGVSNREIGNLFAEKLKDLNIPYIQICPTELDIPLSSRVAIINELYRKYPDGILISLHHNAGGGRGFEVWTSVGQTASDKYATVLGEELQRSFPHIEFRKDMQDGDLDKEAHFRIIKETHCPAVLPECLFYDNWKDYVIIMDEDFRDDYVNALVRWAIDIQNM